TVGEAGKYGRLKAMILAQREPLEKLDLGGNALIHTNIGLVQTVASGGIHGVIIAPGSRDHRIECCKVQAQLIQAAARNDVCLTRDGETGGRIESEAIAHYRGSWGAGWRPARDASRRRRVVNLVRVNGSIQCIFDRRRGIENIAEVSTVLGCGR